MSIGPRPMRVDPLYLESFKNLQKFEVDFGATSSRQVVVGRNGVGKSSLLEVLGWIFRQLDLEEEATFGYEIEYHCNGHYVKIISSATQEEAGEAHVRFRRSYQISAAVGPEILAKDRPYKSIKQNDFYRRNRAQGALPNPDRIIPLYVFGYYSGTSSRFPEPASLGEVGPSLSALRYTTTDVNLRSGPGRRFSVLMVVPGGPRCCSSKPEAGGAALESAKAQMAGCPTRRSKRADVFFPPRSTRSPRLGSTSAFGSLGEIVQRRIVE
ncbi:MAG TPA: AAA family ATPase [Devosia sp.]|nr:AAA family ATPase [Devosia sp.]